jgi:hypothetical protein
MLIMGTQVGSELTTTSICSQFPAELIPSLTVQNLVFYRCCGSSPSSDGATVRAGVFTFARLDCNSLQLDL